MSFCSECGNEVSDQARFCSNCGNSTQPDAPQQYTSSDWLTLDDVINDRDLRLGAIGALLGFFAAFCPWGSVDLLMASVGTSSPMAWLVALASIAAAVFLFRQRSASIVMVIGIVVGAIAVLSALTGVSGGAPSWGVLLALAGGGLMGYAGYRARSVEASY